MKFEELPIGEPCGLKGGRHVFCRFAPGGQYDFMVFVMGTGSLAHVSEFGGEKWFTRNDFGIVNPYGEIETECDCDECVIYGQGTCLHDDPEFDREDI